MFLTNVFDESREDCREEGLGSGKYAFVTKNWKNCPWIPFGAFGLLD